MKTVEIQAGKKPGTQLVVVTASKAGLTKEQAVKSLGSHASRYIVKEWTPSPDKKEKKG